jgi:asparagine synthase (glutamine-hydrolysing)
MCGIFLVLDIKGDPVELRKEAINHARKLRHRGPDWSGVYSDDKAVICHERLSIVDVTHGAQPLVDKLAGRVLAVNGEIYNHKILTATKLSKKHEFQTQSDCEPLLYLYDEHGPDFVKLLNGIFAFVIYDPKDGSFMIARDHMGIEPLYWGRDGEGNLFVSSEMKAMHDLCPKVEVFPPGHYYTSAGQKLVKWYEPAWAAPGAIPKGGPDLDVLRESLEAAVKRQLMCDVPYGILISGGLDSSVISAIAAKHAEKRVESGETAPAWWPRMACPARRTPSTRGSSRKRSAASTTRSSSPSRRPSTPSPTSSTTSRPST